MTKRITILIYWRGTLQIQKNDEIFFSSSSECGEYEPLTYDYLSNPSLIWRRNEPNKSVKERNYIYAREER